MARSIFVPISACILALLLAGCRPESGQDHATVDHTDSPREASAFYLQKRLPPGIGEFPVESLLSAQAKLQQMPHVSSMTGRRFAAGIAPDAQAINASWTSLGPGNIGGRTRALVIDPGNPAVIYSGGVGGGVWKTTDGGAHWLPLADNMTNLALASLAMDPANSQVLYAGTGEGMGNLDAIRGAGVFKTSDGGANWTRLAATTSWQHVNDIVISTLNSQRVVAATNNGIWVSNNAGSSFVRQLSANNCSDLAMTVQGGSEVWLGACGVPTAQATVFRSTDTLTWSSVLSEAGMTRINVALRGNRAYAMGASTVNGPDRTGDGIGDYKSQLHAFFRSDDGGQTWTATVRNSDAHWGNTLIMSGYFSCETLRGGIGIGWYANALAIDPLDVDKVWAGSILTFRSDDGGFNWGRVDTVAPAQVHLDHHAIVFDPGFNGSSNQTVYITGDGGIARSLNARAVTGIMPPAPINDCAVPPYASQMQWTRLNHDYAVTQLYHGTPYPDGTRYLAGAQDNYMLRGSDIAGVNGWVDLTCGDGGYSAIDPTNTNRIWAGCQYTDIRRSVDGGSVWLNGDSGITDGPNDVVFIPPHALDPNNPQRLWFGGRRAWRSSDGGASWTQASTTFAFPFVSAIAIAPGMSDRVLIGTSVGRVYRSDAAGTSSSASVWTESVVNAGGYISSLAFQPGSADIVYATISTFGRPHVLKSVDGGANWINVTGSGATGIPDVPVLSLVVDPGDANHLFAGTDVGVLSSNDGGASWAVEITGFPNVSTEWLALIGDANNRTLFAFTHGRGVFRAALAPIGGSAIFSNGYE